MTALFVGCDRHSETLQNKEEVQYYDRNGDGRVDLEIHHFPGVGDADWDLADTNFDGRYDTKTVYGLAVRKTAVDIPVPTGVKIEKKP